MRREAKLQKIPIVRSQNWVQIQQKWIKVRSASWFQGEKILNVGRMSFGIQRITGYHMSPPVVGQSISKLSECIGHSIPQLSTSTKNWGVASKFSTKSWPSLGVTDFFPVQVSGFRKAQMRLLLSLIWLQRRKKEVKLFSKTTWNSRKSHLWHHHHSVRESWQSSHISKAAKK